MQVCMKLSDPNSNENQRDRVRDVGLAKDTPLLTLIFAVFFFIYHLIHSLMTAKTILILR
jgi:hypothetical protein